MRLFFSIIICLCLFLSLCIFCISHCIIPLAFYHQSYHSIQSDVYMYRLMHIDGHHLHSKEVYMILFFQNNLQIEINQSPSNSSLNISSTNSHSFHLDSSIHHISVNHSSKEDNNHNYSSQYKDNPQETHPHSISHSSDVTFVSQLSYVSLFHYNFSIISLQNQQVVLFQVSIRQMEGVSFL